MIMPVGVLNIVNARAGEVMYSKNPNNPDSKNIIINAVRGPGKLIVDGSINAESYVVSRTPHINITEKIPGKQNKMLICKEDFGIEEIPLPNGIKDFSLSEKEILTLAEMAIKIENYYKTPQDIEWAIYEDGDILILQARSLRIIEKKS